VRYWPWAYHKNKHKLVADKEKAKPYAKFILESLSDGHLLVYVDEVKFFLLNDNTICWATRQLLESKKNFELDSNRVQIKKEAIVAVSP